MQLTYLIYVYYDVLMRGVRNGDGTQRACHEACMKQNVDCEVV